MKNGDEGAFACPDNGTENFTTWQGQKGLTKREHFAGLAMQGYMIATLPQGYLSPQDIAQEAVAYADALLAELEKPTEK